MQNEKGEIVDLYVPLHSPSQSLHATTFYTPLPVAHSLIPFPFSQLRPPQMQRNEPHNKSQRPRLRADLRGQSRRERPLLGREPGVRAVRVRPQPRRGRRQLQPAVSEGWVPEGRLER